MANETTVDPTEPVEAPVEPSTPEEIEETRALIAKRYFPETTDVVAGLGAVVEKVVEQLADGFQPLKDVPQFISLVGDPDVKAALKNVEDVDDELKSQLPASAWARLVALAAYETAIRLEKQGK